MRGLASLAVAALALGALVALRPRLQAQQEAAGLVMAAADTRGMSADIAIPTLALGAFRGLVVDYLWIRTITLREQGRTYEARTLAEQIGRLQPRLPEVWRYLGSHLARDLAATEDDWQRRWTWVKNGIALVRDQGLRYNPDAAQLYTELCRIYSDKVNSTMDEHHLRFKTAYTVEARRAGLHLLSVSELASAPPFETLLETDPEVRHLWGKLEKHLHTTLYPWTLLPGYQKLLTHHGDERPPQLQTMIDWLAEPAGKRLLRSCAAFSVKRFLGLDPEAMLRVDREWGPLDWQSSFSAAVYWGALGVEAGQRSGEVRWRSQARRATVLAVKGAMRQGRVRFTKLGVIMSPNLDLIPRLSAIYAEGIAQAEADQERMKRADHVERADFIAAGNFSHNQSEARKDFLVEIVILFSEYGRDLEGKAALEKGARFYPQEPAFKIPYNDFLLQVIADKVTDAGAMDTPDSTTQGLIGLWKRAFQYLALGEEERFRTYERLALAKQVRWQAFLRESAAEDPSSAKRLAIPFRDVKWRALQEATRAFSNVGFQRRLAERVNVPLDRILGGNQR
jgi:hypothetical protein